jgi:hypothetical protein
MGDLVPGFPAIPLKPLRQACREWLGGLPPAEMFKAERDGRARLTRIDGRVYLAADDASTFIEFCRLGSPAMRVAQIASAPKGDQ